MNRFGQCQGTCIITLLDGTFTVVDGFTQPVADVGKPEYDLMMPGFYIIRHDPLPFGLGYLFFREIDTKGVPVLLRG